MQPNCIKKNMGILQARNLIACGFGLGVMYDTCFYPMRDDGTFDCIDRIFKKRYEKKYPVSAFGGLEVTLYQEDPCLKP